MLSKLIDENLLTKKGQGKSTKYLISPTYEILFPVDIEKYYEKEIDEREIMESFNLQLIPETLKEFSVITVCLKLVISSPAVLLRGEATERPPATEVYYVQNDTLFLRNIEYDRDWDTLIRYEYQLIFDGPDYVGKKRLGE